MLLCVSRIAQKVTVKICNLYNFVERRVMGQGTIHKILRWIHSTIMELSIPINISLTHKERDITQVAVNRFSRSRHLMVMINF